MDSNSFCITSLVLLYISYFLAGFKEMFSFVNYPIARILPQQLHATATPSNLAYSCGQSTGAGKVWLEMI